MQFMRVNGAVGWVGGMLLGALCATAAAADTSLNVGSKRFTESYILGEILTQTARAAGETAATHRQGLGNTAIVLNALTGASIDVYPEYTGTIAREILKLDTVPSLAELNARLAPMGLAVGVPLGFNNTYALAMRGDDARAKGIARLSDLKGHPELKLGLSQEFIGRSDGWPGLKRAYDLPFETPRGLDHGLAYEAIAGRQVDAIDIYSTDAKLDKYGLTVLADDRQYFPRYDAVLLYRADIAQRFPRILDAFRKLEGSIDDAAMRRMNAAAELESKDFATVAAEFLAQRTGATTTNVTGAKAASPGDFWNKLFGPDFGRLTLEHLGLVFLSLAASIVIGIPLGMKQAALSLGMRDGTILQKIELPLAAPTILAGIKTSAVINVGTATIAAFIGAGGYGERIVAGLALNDNAMLLAGAIPSAALALVIEGAFRLGEQWLLPAGLRQTSRH